MVLTVHRAGFQIANLCLRFSGSRWLLVRTPVLAELSDRYTSYWYAHLGMFAELSDTGESAAEGTTLYSDCIETLKVRTNTTRVLSCMWGGVDEPARTRFNLLGS